MPDLPDLSDLATLYNCGKDILLFWTSGISSEYLLQVSCPESPHSATPADCFGAEERDWLHKGKRLHINLIQVDLNIVYLELICCPFVWVPTLILDPYSKSWIKDIDVFICSYFVFFPVKFYFDLVRLWGSDECYYSQIDPVCFDLDFSNILISYNLR